MPQNTPDTSPLRDRLAVNRTQLANERTMLAYVRTAVAFLIAGVSLLQFFTGTLSFWGGWLCIAVALLFGCSGLLKYTRMKKALGTANRAS